MARERRDYEAVSESRIAVLSRKMRSKYPLVYGMAAGVVVSLVSLGLAQGAEALDSSSRVEAPAVVEAPTSPTTTTAVPLGSVDFMTAVMKEARDALAHGEAPGAHSCHDIPTINEATAPDLTTDVGWIEATNMLRSEFDLQPVTLDGRLDMTAQHTADVLAANDLFKHLNGFTAGLHTVYSALNYDAHKAGENLGELGDATTNQNRLQIFVCLAQSKGHLLNMIDPVFDLMGMGVAEYPDTTSLAQEGIHGVVAVHFADSDLNDLVMPAPPLPMQERPAG